MRSVEIATVAVVVLLGLAQTVTGRHLLYQGGSDAVHGVGFGDNANFFWTTGNGSWVQASGDRTVNLVADFSPRSSTGFLPHPVWGFGGIYSITFPSKYMGVAVGAAPSGATASVYSLLNAGTVTAVTSQQVLTAEIPTVLLSVDGGRSWARATGIPATTKALVPDMFGVYCASRTLCWAVGGSWLGTDTVSTMAIMMSTSGPGSWTYALCPSNFASAPAVATDACPSGKYLAQGTVSGSSSADMATLLAITSDNAGRNVYAVGAQRTPASNTPPILYSGNSGVSWVSQVAPAISSGGTFVQYQLTSVTAATGKVVYAAGGDVETGDQNGVILLTVNGGFSWLQQTIQLKYTAAATAAFASTPNVGAYYGIAYNRNKAVDATVWAVGAPMTLSAAGPCYNIVKVYLPQGTLSASLYASFVTIPTSSLPLSFGLSCSGVTGTVMYGIVWDNPLHGWIYGKGTVLVTHDGGNTWIFETPNNLLVSGTNYPTAMTTMANVPSNY